MATEAGEVQEDTSVETIKGLFRSLLYYWVVWLYHSHFFFTKDSELDTSDIIDDTTQTSSGVKRKRTEPKDPNAPKRPSTAYIFFNTEMRPKLKKNIQKWAYPRDLNLSVKCGPIFSQIKRRYENFDRPCM